MTEWRVWYRFKNTHTQSQGFATRLKAVKFMGQVISDGGAIRDIKWRGKVISAKETLRLLLEARVLLTASK